MRTRNRRHTFSMLASAAILGLAPLAGAAHFRTEAEGGEANPGPADSFGKLREEFSRKQREAGEVIAKAAAEERDLTDEEKGDNEKRFTRLSQIKSLLAEDAKFADLAVAADPRQGRSNATGITKPREPQGREEFDRTDPERQQFARMAGESDADFEFRQQRAAVNHFIRTGEVTKHLFTLTTGSGSGVLVPAKVGTPILLKQQRNPFRAALIARGFRPIETTDSASLSIPIFDDAANPADVIAQDNTSENNADPSLTALSLGADLYDSGTVWASNKLLNSLSFDLIAWLEPMLDTRIDRAQVTAWVTTLEAATVGKTTASTTGVTYAELLDWQHSIPVMRRANGVFFVADALMRAIRGLVDDESRPLYQMSLRDDQPNTLLGWPVFIVEGLDAPAAGAVSGVAADAEAIIIRDVLSRRIARYKEVPTHPDQFGIRMFADGDMDFVTAGVRTLKHAAS